MACATTARQELDVEGDPEVWMKTAWAGDQLRHVCESPVHVCMEVLTLKSRLSDVDLPCEIPAAITEPEWIIGPS